MTFFNIFSTKKDPETPKTLIQVDNREKNSLVPSLLVKKGFQIEWKQLPVADYLINETAIERKTLQDFKASIINKRIVSQLLELKQYPKHLLLLESSPEKNRYDPPLHPNAFRGFLIAVATGYQIPIILTDSEEDTALYLSLIASKKEKSFSLRPSKLTLTKEEQIQYILEGFPHIGPVKAKALLSKFKSLKEIINAPEEELQKILGKKATEFLEMIN
ncbi:MAG TPA: ERCC4 domain-containing protein [Candidatus Nanoarchaeia archaeon]|nr:ERCC4 domain-containing protein [Candidatus Nanoarchaeia archaeon]